MLQTFHFTRFVDGEEIPMVIVATSFEYAKKIADDQMLRRRYSADEVTEFLSALSSRLDEQTEVTFFAMTEPQRVHLDRGVRFLRAAQQAYSDKDDLKGHDLCRKVTNDVRILRCIAAYQRRDERVAV